MLSNTYQLASVASYYI